MLAAIERLQRYDPTVSVTEIVEAIQDGSAIIMPNVDGFTVLTTPDDERLHVWVGCGYNGLAPNIQQITDELAQYAKELGLKKLTFSSPRRGWLKVYRRLGYEREDNLFVRYV